jgi:hypothetical protein
MSDNRRIIYRSKLQIAITFSLISTLYKSLQHKPSLFQRVSSLDVFWKRLLTMANPLLTCSSPVWTAAPFQLNYCYFICPPYNLFSTDQVKDTICNSTSIVACVSVAAGTCSQSLCLETALHATIYFFIGYITTPLISGRHTVEDRMINEAAAGIRIGRGNRITRI